MADVGIRSASQQRLISELYVLAAVIDPSLRDSAIKGIISNEQDETLKYQLHTLLIHPPLLVPKVVGSRGQLRILDVETMQSASEAFVAMRQGKTITKEEADAVNPWAYLLPPTFNIFFQDNQRRRKILTSDEIQATYKAELSMLGGPSLWSADLASTGGNPVVITLNDDLATLIGVDPTKRIRKNGRWVSTIE